MPNEIPIQDIQFQPEELSEQDLALLQRVGSQVVAHSLVEQHREQEEVNKVDVEIKRSQSDEVADQIKLIEEQPEGFRDPEGFVREGYIHLSDTRGKLIDALDLKNTHERNTDRLTGILGRDGFEDQAKSGLKKALDRAEDYPDEVTVFFMTDADKFKSINDTHGHDAGDEALRRIAELLVVETAMRRTVPEDPDITDKRHAQSSQIDPLGKKSVARQGGDEFTGIMTGLSKEMAVKRINQLRSRSDNIKFSYATNEHDTQTLEFGMSIGAVMIPNSALKEYFAGNIDNAYQELLKAADKAMFEEKSRRKQLKPDLERPS